MFESLIIDKQKAWQEVQKKSTEHVSKKHRGMFELAAKAILTASTALASVVHNSEFVIIPEDEEFGNQVIEFNTKTVMMAIGFEEEEEEEEDNEDEGEDNGEETDRVSEESIGSNGTNARDTTETS